MCVLDAVIDMDQHGSWLIDNLTIWLNSFLQERERANLALLHELLKYNEWCKELDRGRVPDGLSDALNASNE